MGDPLVVPAWYDPAARRWRLSWSDTRPGRLTVDADRFLFATEAGVVFDVPRAGSEVRWRGDRFDLVTADRSYRIHLSRPGPGARHPDRVTPQAAVAAVRAVLDAGPASGRRPAFDVPMAEYHCAGLAFNHEGTLLAAGTSHGMVVLWDVATGTPYRQFMHDLCGGPVPAVAFSADDLYLATAGHDGQLKVREVRTGRVLLKRPHPGPLSAVCFDPSGELLATACADGAVRVWSRRGDIRNQIDGLCTVTTARLTFVPDGTIAVGGKGRVEAFSADGRLQATATREGVRVWIR